MERGGAEDLAARVIAGDRRALARAITLVESMRPGDEAAAESLLAAVLPKAGGAFRIGVSGAPGAGKSTFIEAFGLHLLGLGHSVAVLAVDPSSPRSGGAILGDKTRMDRLAREVDAFIRPTPASGTPGGVALATGEAIALVESAGFDVVIVETVGVGQSEIAVADLVDMFLLLIAPGSGDELQGVKRGIVELADLIVVTKDDGDLRAAAGRIAADYGAALGLQRPATPGWRTRVERCSALTEVGIDRVAAAVFAFREVTEAARGAKRAGQARRRLAAAVHDALERALDADPGLAGLRARLESEMLDGRRSVRGAARRLAEALLNRGPSGSA
ncbi:MAG: methylmalonyl Co-A mutase-associated GTPase MeaB [Alphaproteobacteria bacterium]